MFIGRYECVRQFQSDHLLQDVQDVLSRPADEFGNDEMLEEMWAMKAYQHAEVYFNVRNRLQVLIFDKQNI